ncbi:hypothetical protein [Corynebacterium sp. ACRQJ]|uniref:hypothetical protein n=1 Tax=Corynebacterium sp. ACRQJ TaxID=2918189 RepID=UPI001EF567E1|nr:hypothetical protein [Corynebacterium sp. ACRQJ]MCG7267907.1 hypothetical protein [Corynebacterium sp. ACRQJ]
MRIDPRVLEDAMSKTGSNSLDELGWKFLGKTGTTIRNYHSGKSTPSIATLMILKRITGRPLDDMILTDDPRAA